MKTLIGILRQALPNIAFLSLERISMVTLEEARRVIKAGTSLSIKWCRGSSSATIRATAQAANSGISQR
jgi:hypothetical protein